MCSPIYGRLRVTGSVIEATSALFVSFPPTEGGPDPVPAAVELIHSTLAAKGAIGFVYPALPKRQVRVDARRNVLDVNYLFGVPARTATEAAAALRQVLVWTARENVYNRDCNYLVGIRLAPFTLTPAGVDSLDKWRDFWKATETGSVEGDVRFHLRAKGDIPQPLRFDRVENASGEAPGTVGAGQLPLD